jgi:hypothetical protein
MKAGLHRLSLWIEQGNDLPLPAVRLTRVCLGLVGLLAALQMIKDGYPAARSGLYFNLPLLPVFDLLPAALHAGLIYLLVPLSLLVIAGVALSAAARCFAAILYYVLLSDFFAFHHKLLLLAHAHLLISFLPPTSTRPYAVFAFRATLCAVLFFAALNKMNAFYLSGGVVAEILGREGAVCVTLAWISLMVELGAALMLPFPRWRPWWCFLGPAFHLALIVAGGVGLVFNIVMATLYLYFIRAEPAGTVSGQPGWRVLRRLDVLQVFEWSDEAPAAGPLEISCRGRTWRGWPAVLYLACHLILVHPLFLAFAGVYARLFLWWAPAAVSPLFRMVGAF